MPISPIHSSVFIQRLVQPNFFFRKPKTFKKELSPEQLVEILMGSDNPAFCYDTHASGQLDRIAAEYVLKRMIDDGQKNNLKKYSYKATVHPSAWHLAGDNEKKPQPVDTKFYIIAADELCAQAQEVIEDQAQSGHKHKYHLRGATGLKDSVFDKEDAPGTPGGWFEVDNGFFFFKDKTMFKNTMKLFDAVLRPA